MMIPNFEERAKKLKERLAAKYGKKGQCNG